MRSKQAFTMVGTALLALCFWCTQTAAQPASQREAALLRSVADADPLELARIVRRVGDRAVLRLLDADQPVAARLAAARATPWLRGPERALAPLSSSLLDRDPVLLEAAARAVLRIAEGLDADALGRREVQLGELAPAQAALVEAAARPALREDLRLLVQQAAALLEALGVPGPPLPDS